MSSSLALILTILFGVSVYSPFGLVDLLRIATMMMAWVSVLIGIFRLMACMSPTRSAPPPISDEDLPTYTVMVPLFHEAHMVKGLIETLSDLDYPKAKLDIIFICEAIDPETCAAAREQAAAPFRTLIVPPVKNKGEPQTKPRALNYALERSCGELVTIYDAEDRPHAQQLKQAASAFAQHPDWVAIQAPLHYFNTRDSRITAQFGLEYAGLFQVQLPFFDRLKLPFPLGGTSNHMRGLM